MNNTNIIVLFIIGAVLVMAGAFLKLIKFEYASLFLIVGMTFEGVAALMLIVKMLSKKKNNDSSAT